MTKFRLISALGTIAILFELSAASANAEDVFTLMAPSRGNFGIIFPENIPSKTPEEVVARWNALLDDCAKPSTGVTIGKKEVVRINWNNTIFGYDPNDELVVITREQYEEYLRLKSYCDENHCGE